MNALKSPHYSAHNDPCTCHCSPEDPKSTVVTWGQGGVAWEGAQGSRGSLNLKNSCKKQLGREARGERTEVVWL